MTRDPTDLETLDAIQAELDASNAMLERVWAALEVRGSEPIPIMHSEPFEIEAAFRIDARLIAGAPPAGIRC